MDNYEFIVAQYCYENNILILGICAGQNAIAKALGGSTYKFDEPTSNIDLQTEKMIQNIIDKISEKSTVIIIAHRKSTIESSDKIIYLKDGQIDMIVNKETALVK